MKQQTTPPDLSPAAIKAARRLQALPDGRSYVVYVVKLEGQMVLVVVEKGKAEVCK